MVTVARGAIAAAGRPTPDAATTAAERRRRADDEPTTTDPCAANVVYPRRHARRRGRRHVRRHARCAATRPVLGLDLQGGISVVLAPVGDVRVRARSTSPSTSSATGSTPSASPSPRSAARATTSSSTCPGVKDRDKARRLVGKTAELRFRPVLARSCRPATPSRAPRPPPPTDRPRCRAHRRRHRRGADHDDRADDRRRPRHGDRGVRPDPGRADQQGTEIPTTRLATTSATTASCSRRAATDAAGRATCLGPAALTGQGRRAAPTRSSAAGQGYVVDLTLERRRAATKFNALAAEAFPKPPPQNQVAIVLDGIVQSAPAFQEPRASPVTCRSPATSPRARPRTWRSSSTTARCRCSSRS